VRPRPAVLEDAGAIAGEVGVYEKHARLDGAWRDVVIVERLLPQPVADRRAGPEFL
jgi:hypothetical protein